jgi:hypothetical protein
MPFRLLEKGLFWPRIGERDFFTLWLATGMRFWRYSGCPTHCEELTKITSLPPTHRSRKRYGRVEAVIGSFSGNVSSSAIVAQLVPAAEIH